MNNVKNDIEQIASDWIKSGHLKEGDLFVIGCSTSEVAGKHIGTSGSEEVASMIFEGMRKLQDETGIRLAFQCCEHLNRALIVERKTAEEEHLDEVSVVPVREAGGAMATYAYNQMDDPVVVEHITAQAGMDIGETMIGMHLKHVAVPFRLGKRYIGEARITAAFTRPMLIGGVRAHYK